MRNSPIQQLQHLSQKYTEKYDPIELLAELRKLEAQVEEKIISISNQNATKSANELAKASIKNITAPINENTIKTKFSEIDNVTGGFVNGELIVVGGRPGTGKTQFLINLCKNFGEQKIPCLYFSLDLTEEFLMYRFLSNITQISTGKILAKDLTEEETLQLTKAADSVSQLPIYIDSSTVFNIYSLTEKCKKLIAEKKIRVIFIDCLQLINGGNKRNNRETEISLICRDLKNIAKEFNICIVMSSQLSRAVESRGGSKRPQLSDLRDSGAIEESADKVIFLYRPDLVGITVDENGESTEGVLELILAKNRNGRLGAINMYFNNNCTCIYEFKDLPALAIDQERLTDLN